MESAPSSQKHSAQGEDKLSLILHKLESVESKVSNMGHELGMIKVSLDGFPQDPSVGMVSRIRKLEEFVADQRQRNTRQDTTLLNVKALWAAFGVAAVTFIYHKLTT